MIIDAHAHACGDYLNGHNILKILDQNKADKVIPMLFLPVFVPATV